MCLTLTAFVIATTAGLFGVHEVWRGFAVWTALIAELVAVVAGVAVLLQEYRPQSPQRQTMRASHHLT